MAIFYSIKQGGGSPFEGGYELKGIGHEVALGIEINVLSSFIGKGEYYVPETLLSTGNRESNLLGIIEADVEGPVAGFLDDGGLWNRNSQTTHKSQYYYAGYDHFYHNQYYTFWPAKSQEDFEARYGYNVEA